MPQSAAFAFGDASTFDQNIANYSAELANLDPVAGPALQGFLSALANADQDKGALLDALEQALATVSISSTAQAAATASSIASSPAAPTTPPAVVHWFLEELEIEGFRGINNEGAPLVLKFKRDCVSSITAPNGVGKSSIYDALSFALRGKIDKLDRLLQAERGQDYYLNRFHPAGVGTVKMTLCPNDGTPAVKLTVTRNRLGQRTVAGHPRADALLAELDREFVLLDGPTFESFMDETALNRGRAFSGLLGLARYSALRQQLQQLCHTRSFNAHFDTSAQTTKKSGLDRTIAAARAAIATDYEALVLERLVPGTSSSDAQARCHAALQAIPTLTSECNGKAFMQISGENCHAAVNAAEGGADKQRLASLIQTEALWKAANRAAPTASDAATLQTLARDREQALAATSGEPLQRLYKISDEVMSAEGWPSDNLCPTCGTEHPNSVLDRVRAQLGHYNEVESATTALAGEWAANGWSDLEELERLTIGDQEALLLGRLKRSGEEGTIGSSEVAALGGHLANIRAQADSELQRLADETTRLSSTMPTSLVSVTRAIEAAQRLQRSWTALHAAEGEATNLSAQVRRVTRLKAFLDQASATFAQAESNMAAARLARVEPLCQTLFNRIMFSPVTPILRKPAGTEELSIGLGTFWTLRDVSAQALLSESYRNAFAVSVYLAAASLYGGAPRFIVLDDVTSSFDAGHQHHLVEVIRTQFARPLQADGPQVILLSHDTLLEKLFNKHAGSPAWSHQRLEGTAHTAVLLQSGAVNKVRDATNTLLNQGRVDDAAPRLRQYLEYVLQTIIDKCRIPVPPDLAFGDDKRTPGEYLNAIKAAVELEDRAGSLILEPAQKQALQMHSATIIGNFVSHWATGQTQAFSAPALLGVMQAIDNYQECFRYEPTPGAQRRFYATLHSR
ncbi:AAA family ATPase [Bradyrhizobium iriomotense]|uniref:Rad50/SbcC-type AAA domain-containing protein n=1 Tax=Bradyrhizobium iriomotense TaxID=441950 RepID=A0ABQ6AVW1_9BRAD|nr:AAA family ATPase [Bradyrhizobium iriomotense]GLR84038.1 hypothetical protein GCM10007857_07480 [Bradyrhizobium iriomotense]